MPKVVGGTQGGSINLASETLLLLWLVADEDKVFLGEYVHNHSHVCMCVIMNIFCQK